MRWLVTGAKGMLGRDCVDVLTERGEDVTARSRAELDITDAASVEQAVRGMDVVLNCAGWTAVDDAETEEADAFLGNAVGPALLARAAAQHGPRLVHISTDYVFDGRAQTPYETDHDLQPVSAYGRTKAAGEWAVRAEHPDNHLIVRTAWLYGQGGACFPRTIADLARQRGAVSVVDDQLGQPTWTRDVADFIVRLVAEDAPRGIYHATSSGETSWFEFAREVCTSAGLGAQVVSPTTSAQFQRPAPRPAYSVLGHEAALDVGVAPIGDWRERWGQAAQTVLTG